MPLVVANGTFAFNHIYNMPPKVTISSVSSAYQYKKGTWESYNEAGRSADAIRVGHIARGMFPILLMERKKYAIGFACGYYRSRVWQ